MSGAEPPDPLGLYTDLYELRMVQTYLRHGMTRPATFSLFVRPTPRRPWLIAYGVGAAMDLLERFTYGADELAYLRTIGIAEDTIAWLGSMRVTGELWAVDDGTVVLANEPILEFSAPLPIAQLVETALVNVVQYPTLVATKAARCVAAADGRPVIDFGFRRAHGLETGVDAAVAAYVGGCAGSSNVEAGRRHAIPVFGTMAHSFVQAFDDEEAAFTAFAADHPDDATLLVDTFDTLAGVAAACRAVPPGALQGVRLDSGDLDELSRAARALLDDAGHTTARVFVSGGIDETDIADLVTRGAPIDAFGVGTSLVVSRDQPALDIVYKLVEYDGVPRAKYSADKESWPGRKQVVREGDPASDVLMLRDEPTVGEPLLHLAWRDGARLRGTTVEQARDRVRAQVATLPTEWRRPAGPATTPVPRISEALRRVRDEVRARRTGG